MTAATKPAESIATAAEAKMPPLPPAKQLPAKKSAATESWEWFRDEITKREAEIGSMLPRHVSKERFIASAIAAVKQTPGLLECTPRSLFSAITKSAQDGLLPDGREGVITIYNEKQKDNSYEKVAQWNPMTFGLRKRARELDRIIVSTQTVSENDHFIWHEGDDPKIEHEPAKLGTPRGPMIGAYAIFRTENGAVLHREVMDKNQIESVQAQSKNPDGLMWKKFTTEAWRKTVVRRGFKTVPCSEHLQVIVSRDDETFSFDEPEPTGPIPPKPVRADYVKRVEEAKVQGAPTIDAKTENWPLVDHIGETTADLVDGWAWANAFIELLSTLIDKAKIGLPALETYIDNNRSVIAKLKDDPEAADLVNRNIDAAKNVIEAKPAKK